MAQQPQWAKASFLSSMQDHIQLDTPHLVGLLWMSDQLITETSTWQNTTLTTDIHAPGGIRTYYLGKQAATDPRPWLRGLQDQQTFRLLGLI